MDFSYQLTSAGAVPIRLQAFTITGFNNLVVDVIYLASAGNNRFMTATRSVDGSSINIQSGGDIDFPVVFRTNSFSYDSTQIANLEVGYSAGPGPGALPNSSFRSGYGYRAKHSTRAR